MNFQDQRGLFANRARIICKRCFVGGADFAQFRATRLKDFADPKTAADLDQFAARNDHFVFGADPPSLSIGAAYSAAPSSKVTDDQNERSCAVVHDRGRFRLAEDGEGALEISTAITAIAGGEVQLQIIIRGSDVPKHFARALRKWRSAEVGMNDDTGSVDYRLNPVRAKFTDRGANKIDNGGEVRDVTLSTN